MPVAQAEKEVAVERNHVYVIPPNTTLTVRDQHLHLAIRPSAPARHMPVDALLKSLAADWGDASIGVILSGGDSDGALGIEAIKHEVASLSRRSPLRRAFRACRAARSKQGAWISYCAPERSPTSWCAWSVILICARFRRHSQRTRILKGSAGAKEEEHLRRVFRRLRVAHGADFTHYKRGVITLKRERVELYAVARQTAEASRTRMEERHQEFSLSLPEQPMVVNGDPVRLERVIANLLDNAAKYTERGGTIRLALTQGGNEAVLSVKDSGIGLAPEMLESIFEPFTRVDRSLDRSSGGLGLGLSVVRPLLQLHGGRIEARSAGLGQGSEFIVRLPLATANPVGLRSEQCLEVPPRNSGCLAVC